MSSKKDIRKCSQIVVVLQKSTNIAIRIKSHSSLAYQVGIKIDRNFIAFDARYKTRTI